MQIGRVALSFSPLSKFSWLKNVSLAVHLLGDANAQVATHVQLRSIHEMLRKFTSGLTESATGGRTEGHPAAPHPEYSGEHGRGEGGQAPSHERPEGESGTKTVHVSQEA